MSMPILKISLGIDILHKQLYINKSKNYFAKLSLRKQKLTSHRQYKLKERHLY